ncbi:MAG: hypothetical protein K2X87_21430 [Gemmataceae bacterium]|nr:hypothetical protein [Gemmataceae bacterium]
MTRLLPAAVAAAVLAASPAAAQPPAAPPVSIPADGTEVFRYLLHKRGVKPLKAAELAKLGDSSHLGRVIVIVIGQPERSGLTGGTAADWGGRAIRRGGAALIAGDTYHAFDPPYAQPLVPGGQNWRYAFFGRRLTNRDPDRVYADNPNCPLAVPWPRPARSPDGPEWGLFDGLTRVATNRPSFLQLPALTDEFQSALAGFPPGTWLDRNRFNVADRSYPLAVGGSGPQPEGGESYRFLAVADPDVFTNEMMIPLPGVEPSDNLEFARRVVSFLVEEGGEDRRTRCLFVQNGKVIERFDALESVINPPPPPLPIPALGQLQEKLVDAGNQILDKLQENDALNRGLLPGDEDRRAATVRKVAEYLLVVAAVWAAIMVVRRVWGARHPADLPPPPPAGRPPVREGTRPAGVFDRRQKELLRRDDLAEPVRAVIREMFRAAGAPADAGPRLPQVRVAGAVGRPDTLLAALEELWKVAYDRPARVTARRWAALEPLFVRAKQAHADGKWAFTWYDPDPT